MPGKTSIQWTDYSWNPLTGCTRVSPGCQKCYAFELHDKRHKAFLEGKDVPPQYAQPFSEVQLFPERLGLPLTWKKPRKIFVASMSDLFHKDVPDDFILSVFNTMVTADHHIYQVLTKRPSRLVDTRLIGKILSNIAALTGKTRSQVRWPAHIWLGTSVENQDYTWRIDKLRQVPAPIRFISAEPLLGPLELDLMGISWLIAGSESGHGARPAQVDWYRSLRDQAIDAKVAFFLKQFARNGHKIPLPELDGKTWNEFPLWIGKRYQESEVPQQ